MAARLLVLTDDPSLERLLTTALAADDRLLRVVGSHEEALGAISIEPPHLAILDANVPGDSAWAILAHIRAATGQGHVPVIMLGRDDARDKVRGLRAGADDYQALPVHPAELVARVRRLLSRFPPGGVVVAPVAQPSTTAQSATAATQTRGQVIAVYGAKGGVGSTTIAINAAIAFHRHLRRNVVLVDGNLQFGDHRVFMDLGNDRYSIVDAVTAPSIDADLLRTIVVHHESGIDLLLAPPRPEEAEHVSAERHHMATIVETLRRMYDYVIVDLDERLDDHCLDVISVADRMLVVMTADLSCIKNVRLVIETMAQIGMPDEMLELLLNRSNAYTGIGPRSIEAVLKRPIRHQVVNDYRTAISALNSGEPFLKGRPDAAIARSITEVVRAIEADPKAPRDAAPQPLLSATVHS
ncbi:MAG: AAA family ATPase [Chloroflexi bacterium]|nr:AAA family ATPase [Chloroflexota bacterium]